MMMVVRIWLKKITARPTTEVPAAAARFHQAPGFRARARPLRHA